MSSVSPCSQFSSLNRVALNLETHSAEVVCGHLFEQRDGVFVHSTACKGNHSQEDPNLPTSIKVDRWFQSMKPGYVHRAPAPDFPENVNVFYDMPLDDVSLTTVRQPNERFSRNCCITAALGCLIALIILVGGPNIFSEQ